MSTINQLARLDNIRLAALLAGALAIFIAATASRAQSTQPESVKEFGSRNPERPQKELVKDFSSGDLTPKSSAKEADKGESASGMDDADEAERARQADLAFKKKLKNAKLPESFDTAVKYQELGDLEKAIPFYKKVLEEDPKFESAYNNLALCLAERKATGDLDEAKELLAKSQELSSCDASSSSASTGENSQASPSKPIVNEAGKLFVQGQLSEQSGDLRQAAVYYQKALDQQKPLNLIIVRHLSKLYVKLGNYNSARALLKRGVLSAPPAGHMRFLYQAITDLDNQAKSSKVE